MKIGFLITARLKSTRLPKKLLLKINRREIIRHMIDRLKMSESLSNIIICTSDNLQDKPLIKIAKEEGIDYFLGDEEDVILRLYNAAKEFKLDYVLNITADCPLVAIEFIDKIVNKYKESNADFIRCLDLPHGFFSYGLKIDAMKKAIVAKKNIKKAEKLSLDNLWFKRTIEESPIKQNQFLQLIGLRVLQDIKEDEIINFTKVEYKFEKVSLESFTHIKEVKDQ